MASKIEIKHLLRPRKFIDDEPRKNETEIQTPTQITQMNKGQVEKAERLALNQFDKWNEVTGFAQENTGYYYELQSLMKDAVHIGIQMAINGKVTFDKEGNVKIL